MPSTEHAPGAWELSKDMEPALRELGERGDIIRTMQKALGPQGGERDPMSFQIHDGAPETPIIGRVVDKHLSDELGENLTIVVDGIDGRTHHIAGIAPERLHLEITESVLLAASEQTLATLHQFKDLGVRIAMDDFGTGYSSLSYLRSFPFDKLKIDRSFIVDLLEHQGATAIIRAITTLADALGIETTAEGVEHSDQLDILRAEGCGQIQGYLFSRPIPAQDVDALLDKLDGARKAA